MEIGRKIYFDKASGNILVDTGERSGAVVETTQEEDFAVYTALSERNPATVGVIELAYGDYAQDFAGCSGYRVNTSTLALEFSYPDPSAPQTPTAYQPPLTEQVSDLQQTVIAMQDAVNMVLGV
ncbi:hypothetical protein PASE110613_09050 [Paenibacillus sediminis]|uniref:Uncharacterized protein n=1 Tax=Paenibacillus sediminis TaxID=664909 RepID=A0ABS4H6Q4_9BACL|nr:hypothetical protein [Paenibacillus sediminis]MBP1938207.1 hypothetical protein [Paenibacillus sediminis]